MWEVGAAEGADYLGEAVDVFAYGREGGAAGADGGEAGLVVGVELVWARHDPFGDLAGFGWCRRFGWLLGSGWA
ncbi:hypothetical protein Psuf_060530 [Phytohabitans suffuscus]|uniref:Uncharacterized protein n=1 Tax=Phytohabitans suffuscus TaxID=624315 RepID=A0A6F8YRG2_9ACTN|nr:hypothetical protein Psuf_060530 [Phytohabitans suffuscus]